MNANNDISSIKVGDIFPSNECGNFEILELIDAKKEFNESGKLKYIPRSAKVRFILTGYETITRVGHVQDGGIRDPYYPSVYGVGYVGNAKASINGKHKPLYKVWNDMIARCYNPNDKSYMGYGAKGITVCDRWLCFEYFEIDAQLLPGYQEMVNNPGVSYHLDKDILQEGVPSNQKVYSPTTCMWIPANDNIIQSVIDNKYKRDSNYFYTYPLKNDTYNVRIRNKNTGDNTTYGTFTNEIAAANMANHYINGINNNENYIRNNVPYMSPAECMKYLAPRSKRIPVQMIKTIKK